MVLACGSAWRVDPRAARAQVHLLVPASAVRPRGSDSDSRLRRGSFAVGTGHSPKRMSHVPCWACPWVVPLTLACGEALLVVVTVASSSSESAAVDPDSLIRLAHRRRNRAADVPSARCQHRPVGLGRRTGPAAGRILTLALGDSPLAKLRNFET